jgi:uncharacterized damage-inducible protein DinB
MDLSYPIGKFEAPAALDAGRRGEWLRQIAEAPARFREAVRGLDDAQLDTSYRPGGWTIRQVVHHMADSHVNAYIRYRLALTEDRPTIKPYDQTAWAELADARTLSVETSLAILEGVHQRWVALAESLAEANFARTFLHPERGEVRLDSNLAMYAWHGRHHAAHILGLRERMGWQPKADSSS